MNYNKITLKENGLDVEYYLVPVRNPQTSVIDTDIKVAIVVGHHEDARGAKATDGYTEWDLFSDYMEYCDQGYSLNFNFDWFTHETTGSYSKRQEKMSEKTKDYDLVFELHFNSFNGKAEGAEALYNDMNETTEKVAIKFVELMNEKMGIKKRKVKPIRLTDGKNEKGEGFIKATNKDAILLEPFFGDNEEDYNKFQFSLFDEVLNETVAYYKELKS